MTVLTLKQSFLVALSALFYTGTSTVTRVICAGLEMTVLVFLIWCIHSAWSDPGQFLKYNTGTPDTHSGSQNGIRRLCVPPVARIWPGAVYLIFGFASLNFSREGRKIPDQMLRQQL
jgi:hypothetical protein